MNYPYGYLKEEFTDDNEIQNDKELRKIKKKLRSLKQKEDIEGSRKLEILINEYENINKTVETNQNNKKTQKKETDKKKESDSFLEKEYQKNKEKNAEKYAEEAREKKRKAEADEEQRRREEQRREQNREQRREQKREQNREQNREQRRRGEQNRVNQMSRGDQLLNNHGLKRKNLPSDILEIIENYSHSLWKKLSLKYHPDKYNGEDKYSKFLNSLKDENK